MSIRAPSNYDLRTQPKAGKPHVPEKARDPNEIARRKELTPGDLVLEQQHSGLRVARMTLTELVDNRESLDFALPLIGACALNSAWYTFAHPERSVATGVRRRTLKHPVLKDWTDADHLLAGVLRSLERGEALAADLVGMNGIDSPAHERRKRDFSTCVGNAALASASVVGLGDGPIPGTHYRAQLAAREWSLQLEEVGDTLAVKIGSIPTLAQLSERDSDLNVHWRKAAPNPAYNAHEAALRAVID